MFGIIEFLLRDADMHSAYLVRQRVWVSVTVGIVSKRLKLFRPSGSPIIEAFGTPCADTKFQGEPLQRGLYIHGGMKNWPFRRKLPFISETVRDRTMVSTER